MNPNLVVFLKRGFVFTLIVSAFGLGIFFLRREGLLDLEAVGTYFMNAFLVFMVALMCILFGGLLLKLMWTAIMNRADAIVLCCPDTNGEGIHMITRHYHAGGESSEGFNTFSHYYIVLSSGKAFLSKKVGEEGNDIARSLADLRNKTKTQLNPNTAQAITVGSNTTGDNKPTHINAKVGNGSLDIKGYEGLIDFGFRLEFNSPKGKSWKMRL